MNDRYAGKRVLVTGGAGFVGSNLVKALVKEGAIVTVLDDMSTGDIKNLVGVKGEYTMYMSSVNDETKTQNLISKVDIVFHVAARNIIVSTKNPRDDFKTNIGGTLNVLLAVKDSNVEKMVYTSSASVYGNPKYLPINEDDGINLLTPYAVSKYAGEGYCMAFYESYKMPVAVLRLSNVYGTNQSVTNPYCGVVAKFMDRASRGERVEIHGDGSTTRDFTHVDDVVEALMLAGISRVDGEVFNVATGIETSINDLAHNVIDMWGNTTSVTHIDRRDIDNIRRRVLNIEKIRRKLGWMPSISLQEGLRLTKETKCYA